MAKAKRKTKLGKLLSKVRARVPLSPSDKRTLRKLLAKARRAKKAKRAK